MRPLELRDVTFTYAGEQRPALDGLTLEVEKGEFVTLLGENGSGKSTVCMLTNGLIPNALRGQLAGSAKVFGFEVREHSVAEFATRVGMVFQEPESQLFCMSVEEEVSFGPENLAVPREQLRERIEWALELVGLKGYNDCSPFSLSGGETERVAIAAALSMRPEMLVLDEPGYALDPVGRQDLYRVLRDLRDRQGMTILLAERDAEELSSFSDRMILMRSGRVVKSGTPKEVLKDAESLRSMGVLPPQLSEVSVLLNRRLGRSDLDFSTVAEAENAISGILSSKRRGGRA